MGCCAPKFSPNRWKNNWQPDYRVVCINTTTRRFAVKGGCATNCLLRFISSYRENQASSSSGPHAGMLASNWTDDFLGGDRRDKEESPAGGCSRFWEISRISNVCSSQPSPACWFCFLHSHACNHMTNHINHANTVGNIRQTWLNCARRACCQRCYVV